MKKVDISVGEKTFSARVADTEDSRQEGLSKTKDLPAGQGMLFVFDDVQDVTMNMVSMEYPLDMLFISEDDVVVSLRQMKPGKYDTSVEDVLYVLEVNAGEGEGLVGAKVEIKDITVGAVGAARRGAKFDIRRVLRRGGLFI